METREAVGEVGMVVEEAIVEAERSKRRKKKKKSLRMVIAWSGKNVHPLTAHPVDLLLDHHKNSDFYCKRKSPKGAK